MTCFRLSAQVPEVLLCSAEHLISHLHLLTVSGATYDSSSVVFINVLSFCGWCISTSAVPFFFLVPAMATDTARLSGHLLLVVCYLKWKKERSHGSRSLQLACTHVTKEQFFYWNHIVRLSRRVMDTVVFSVASRLLVSNLSHLLLGRFSYQSPK